MSYERDIITDPMMWRQRPSPTTGAITQYFRTDIFTRQDFLTAYAARADFKFIIYDVAFSVNQEDSTMMIGHGVDVIDRVIAIMNQDRRNYATNGGANGSVLKFDLADMHYIRAQYVALYGAVNKPPFDVPVI